ncbi:MAG: hypothetical protein QGG67_17255 [Gammaproteobacteria bacterium]|jgi:photosystem II stability/assembly factor-like uncharacterized protein|nr:hypothetical protein [Gammaproteobacteria bacterium]
MSMKISNTQSTACRTITIGFLLALCSLQLNAVEEVIFSDDFSGNLDKWNIEFSDLWSTGNGILRGEGGDWITTRQDFFDQRFRVNFRLKLIGEDVHLNLRNGAVGRYFINFGINGIRLNKQFWPETFLVNLQVNEETDYFTNTWYDIEIIHDANILVMSVDGIEKISYTDTDPLQSGDFGFEVFTDSPIEVDFLEIYGEPVEAFVPWLTTGGPQGGLGYDIRMRRDDSNSMLVTDANAGIFKSSNGGASWIATNEGIDARTGATGDLIPVFSLTIDPNNPATIWVGTAGIRGIFRSLDGGNTWERKNNGVVEATGITFRGIAIEPGNSDVMYAAAEIDSSVWNGEPSQGREFDMTAGVVYKSVDAGDNWNAVWRGNNLARYILINPDATDTIYVSTGIFDREAANSDPNTPLKTVPGGEGVIKSTDAGASWQNINNGIDNLYVGSLVLGPADPDRLLAGVGNSQYFANSGVYYSTNGGQSWNQGAGIADIITAVEFSESDSGVAYAGSVDAIYKSQDDGQNWARLGEDDWGPEGIRAGFPSDFQLDFENSNRLFVNNYAGGNYLSLDGGETWSTASQGYTGAMVRDVIVDPDNPGHVLAASRSGLFETPDGGTTWLGRNNGIMKVLEWNAIAMSPASNQKLLAASNFIGEVSSSDDGGLSWNLVGNSVTGNKGWRVVTFANSSRVYAGSAGYESAGTFSSNVVASGVQRSNDSGLSWSWVNSGAMSDAHVTSITTAADNIDLVFVATTNRGVLRSSNGGDSWQKLQGGLPDIAALSVAVDPRDSTLVFAGFEEGGLYRSSDGGDNWSLLTSGINPEGQITDVVFDSTDSMILYAADKSAGVYRTTDGGNRWNTINMSLTNREVNSLAVSGDGLNLYAATEGGGIFRLDVNETVPATYDIFSPDNGSAGDSGTPSKSGSTATVANFNAGVLAIPVVAVGSVFFRLDLVLSNAETSEFILGPFEQLTDPDTTGASVFSDNVLSIPEVVVGDERFQVELTLTSPDPITFTVTGAQPL